MLEPIFDTVFMYSFVRYNAYCYAVFNLFVSDKFTYCVRVDVVALFLWLQNVYDKFPVRTIRTLSLHVSGQSAMPRITRPFFRYPSDF